MRMRSHGCEENGERSCSKFMLFELSDFVLCESIAGLVEEVSACASIKMNYRKEWSNILYLGVGHVSILR